MLWAQQLLPLELPPAMVPTLLLLLLLACWPLPAAASCQGWTAA